MILRTGIDIVENIRLTQIRAAILERFIQRVYTPAEQKQANGQTESLAGLFAVKEAVSKALGTGIGWVRWQDIEVLNGKYGEPVLHLHGNAAKVAEHLGLDHWSVSISHEKTHTVAVAVAIGGLVDRTGGQLPPAGKE